MERSNREMRSERFYETPDGNPDDLVEVGDRVSWRGAWGEQSPQVVTVTALDLTAHPREKYGRDVPSVSWSMVRRNRVVFTLSNGHWAFGSQIARVGATS